MNVAAVAVCVDDRPMESPPTPVIDREVALSPWAEPWQSGCERWWTQRRTSLTRAQRDAGCAVTVSADTPEALAELLSSHDALAALAERLARRP